MENPIKMDDLGVPLFWKHPHVCFSIDSRYAAQHAIAQRLFQFMLVPGAEYEGQRVVFFLGEKIRLMVQKSGEKTTWDV